MSTPGADNAELITPHMGFQALEAFLAKTADVGQLTTAACATLIRPPEGVSLPGAFRAIALGDATEPGTDLEGLGLPLVECQRITAGERIHALLGRTSDSLTVTAWHRPANPLNIPWYGYTRLSLNAFPSSTLDEATEETWYSRRIYTVKSAEEARPRQVHGFLRAARRVTECFMRAYGS